MSINAAILIFYLEGMRYYFRNAKNSNEYKTQVEDRVRNGQENHRKKCVSNCFPVGKFIMLYEPINVR